MAAAAVLQQMQVMRIPARHHAVADVDRITEKLGVGNVCDELLVIGEVKGDLDVAALVLDGVDNADRRR